MGCCAVFFEGGGWIVCQNVVVRDLGPKFPPGFGDFLAMAAGWFRGIALTSSHDRCKTGGRMS